VPLTLDVFLTAHQHRLYSATHVGCSGKYRRQIRNSGNTETKHHTANKTNLV